jgi:transketolase
MIFDTSTPIRDGFGRALVELGRTNKDVVALTADLSDAIRVLWFAREFPDRFYQMGVSENDMMATAAGLALMGKIPFATTFATFATSLANQPIKVAIAYNRANVKIATSHGGICVGADGATHQSFDDIALMRMLPGMCVVVPCDATEAYKATFAVAEHVGPVYLRLGRIATPPLTAARDPFVIGRANTLRAGSDVAVIATGFMAGLALEAAAGLEKSGLSVRVINMHTVKPLDEKAVVAAARECGSVVTVEEHSILGGLGGAVAECLSRTLPTPQEYVGIKDVFGEGGEPADILEKYGLTARAVAAAVKRAAARKPKATAGFRASVKKSAAGKPAARKPAATGKPTARKPAAAKKPAAGKSAAAKKRG